MHQLKIDLVHLLANEIEYIDDSFVMVLSEKRFLKLIFKNFLQI